MKNIKRNYKWSCKTVNSVTIMFFRIGKAQAAFDLAVEAIEWSGLKKDVRSDLTVNLQVCQIVVDDHDNDVANTIEI